MAKSTKNTPNEYGELEGLVAEVVQRSLTVKQDALLSECPTNIDLSTYEGKCLAVAATSPGDVEFKEGKAVVMATHWILFPDEQVDEDTGEVKQFTRLVLFDRVGRSYRTTSMSAARKMKAILALFPPEEWERGISFVITERASKRPGRTAYHDIRVVPRIKE